MFKIDGCLLHQNPFIRPDNFMRKDFHLFSKTDLGSYRYRSIFVRWTNEKIVMAFADRISFEMKRIESP